MNHNKRFALGSWLPCTEHEVLVLVHGRLAWFDALRLLTILSKVRHDGF